MYVCLMIVCMCADCMYAIVLDVCMLKNMKMYERCFYVCDRYIF